MIKYKLQNIFTSDGYSFLKTDKIQVDIDCDENCIKRLCLFIYYEQVKSESHRHRNYRGIEQLFFSKIEERIYSILSKQAPMAVVQIKVLVILEPTPSLHIAPNIRGPKKEEF